jgi:hypothetical protein
VSSLVIPSFDGGLGANHLIKNYILGKKEVLKHFGSSE